MSSTGQFQDRLNQIAKDTDALLDSLLAAQPVAHELARPERLLDAMRYASLGAGKRFRPFLVVESAALFGVPASRALTVGAALECVHCYSLVHDDLPAMGLAARSWLRRVSVSAATASRRVRKGLFLASILGVLPGV